MSAWWLSLVPFAFVLGVLITLYVVARDEKLVRIESDEIIVKKPGEGLVLVALTQEMARRVIMKKENTASQTEARDLYLRGNQ